MSETAAPERPSGALREPERSVRPPDADDLSRFVASALAAPARSRWTALVLPAPAGDATSLLDTLARTDAFALAPPSGPDVVAVGAAERIALRGERRFEAARDRSRELLSSIELRAHPDAPAVTPRVFCGFSFAPGSADREPWSELGDGLLLLPRWAHFGGPRPALLCILDRTHDHGGRTALVQAELEAVLGALATAPHDRPTGPTRLELESAELHAGRVEAALRAIRDGDATKIVVARRAEATAEGSFDPGTAYRALCRAARRGSSAFLVRRGSTAFVGATPELLLSRRGPVLRTMALAGTAAPGGSDLLRSQKDLAEHRVVVEAIRTALDGCAERVEVEDAPRVTSAGPMVHLRTSITARLGPEVSALDVAARLHPTPAVAGAPRETATRFIERAEPARGWYAGPLGWVDQDGDAELVVALRCGLLRGGRAFGWAGGGIVEGSTAAEERAETELKLRPFLDAIGARR